MSNSSKFLQCDLSHAHYELRILKDENEKLKKQLNHCQQLLTVDYTKDFKYMHTLFHKVPKMSDLLRQFDNTKDDAYFITVTFDPEIIETLGLTTTLKQKAYLIEKVNDLWYQVNDLLETTPVRVAQFGCLEFQLNGTLHAHFILQFQRHEEKNDYWNSFHEIINTLKYQFTFNVYNKRAIHWRVVDDLEKAIEYIIKEPYVLFKNGLNKPMVIEEEDSEEDL